MTKSRNVSGRKYHHKIIGSLQTVVTSGGGNDCDYDYDYVHDLIAVLVVVEAIKTVII